MARVVLDSVAFVRVVLTIVAFVIRVEFRSVAFETIVKLPDSSEVKDFALHDQFGSPHLPSDLQLVADP